MLNTLRDSPTGREGYWVFLRDGSVGYFPDEAEVFVALNSSPIYLDTVLSILKGTKVRIITERKVVIKALEVDKP